MSNIRKLVRRCTAWLLCMAMAAGCFHGLRWTAFAVDAEESFETIKSWSFDSDTEGWQFNSGWSSDYKGGDVNVTQEVGQLKPTMDYSQHGSDGWMQAAISCGQDQMPDLTGAERVTMDVSYEPSKLTDGAITIKVSLGSGDGSASVASAQAGASSGTEPAKETITIDLSNKATQADFVICIVGQNTTYTGSIWLDNIKVEKTAPKEPGEEDLTPPATDLHGQEEQGSWSYKQDWNYQYTDQQNTAIAIENGMVKVTVDYTADANQNYSKMAFSNADTLNFDTVTQVTFDFYYDTAKMTSGSFQITVGSTEDVLKISETSLDLSIAETVNGTLKKLPVTRTCSSVVR